MRGYRQSLFALLLVSACGGNPFIETPPGPGDGGTTVPDKVKRNLKTATYVAGEDTIKVNMTSQDASALNAEYERNTDFDIDGYLAYTYQETTSNRMVLALVKESGSVKGLVAMEGGQFSSYHSGGDFVRATVFSLPSGGLGERYTYSGTYVGLMNIGTPLPGPGGDLDPQRGYRTSGRALITADFTEMRISGGVDERQIIDPMVDANGVEDPSLDPKLATISLFETDITSSGTFAGDVKIGTKTVGDYAGLFGGLQAKDVATVLFFNPYGSDPIVEHGLIVLTNCADDGGPACP